MLFLTAVHAFGAEPDVFGAGNCCLHFYRRTATFRLPHTVLNPLFPTLVSDAGTFVLAETALDMHCWGENPVVTAKLQLNGQDRFSEREGSYFDTVQPYQHHTRAPDAGINVYSFALRPEEHQPSGSCNFSRIDNAVLQLSFPPTLLLVTRLPRSVSTLSTTTFSESCRVWPGSLTAIKRSIMLLIILLLITKKI